MLALVGGLLIGVSSTLNLYWYGRITGMSGIFNSLIKFDKEAGFFWKFCFFSGLIFVPSIIYYSAGTSIKDSSGNIQIQFFDTPQWTEKNLNVVGQVIAGLLVGIGTRMGNGCTSGHAVCGVSRLSFRSIVATGTFMSTAIALATLRYYKPFL